MIVPAGGFLDRLGGRRGSSLPQGIPQPACYLLDALASGPISARTFRVSTPKVDLFKWSNLKEDTIHKMDLWLSCDRITCFIVGENHSSCHSEKRGRSFGHPAARRDTSAPAGAIPIFPASHRRRRDDRTHGAVPAVDIYQRRMNGRIPWNPSCPTWCRR